ncbi:PhoH family protein [Candidatus Saccharibacteria bacterium]|nr:PhoH family protein [Candidatus Saccharibacteria bacterium]
MSIFKEDRPIYVIDTNILVDYPDIIPSGCEEVTLEEPTVDLSQAHIVIPTAVIRELSSFKKEASERGKVARKILRRLRPMFEQPNPEQTALMTGEHFIMGESYDLKSLVLVGEQCFSILPVHKSFKKSLPFSPSDDDMDGQIILATIAVEFIFQGIPVDGTADPGDVKRWVPTGRIKLLTNDNGMAIRANQRGVITSRYGYKLPAPYTGRREVIVPKDLLIYFVKNGEIEQDIWGLYMGEGGTEFGFVANEFIIMRTDDEDSPAKVDNTHMLSDKSTAFSHIGRYDALSNTIVALQYLNCFPEPIMNEGQAIYVEALMNPEFSAVICTGPAGSGKTYMATVYGCRACETGEYIGVTVVPCASQSKIGALPGDLNDKMDPDVQPFKNALRNYLLKTDYKLRSELEKVKKHGMSLPRLDDDPEKDNRSISQKVRDQINAIWDAWFSNIPIESARGRDFSHELALYDEFQDQNATQADTLIKRLGMEGKIVITGDIEQVHAPYLDSDNNGIVYATQLLYDNPMVAKVHFTEDEVVRHPLVKMVAERQQAKKS